MYVCIHYTVLYICIYHFREQVSKGERKLMRTSFTGILPQISEILQNVNPQMLLILKTNDLMRGIEHTLKTGVRMGSFRVMSECCIKSVYEERIRKCMSKIDRVKLSFAEFWALLKIKLYYAYLNMKQLSFNIVR